MTLTPLYQEPPTVPSHVCGGHRILEDEEFLVAAVYTMTKSDGSTSVEDIVDEDEESQATNLNHRQHADEAKAIVVV